LETLVQQQLQQQTENVRRILELLQQQRPTVTADDNDSRAERTVTFDAETDESHA